MKIKWLGHASFLITSDSGTRIITDPYTPSPGRLNYTDLNESADIVISSHEHGDHNNAAAIKGNPQVLKGAGAKEAKGIQFKGTATFHDDTDGTQRGPNTVFCFIIDGIRLCHLGDLGHKLSAGQLKEVGPVDIVLSPVAGTYTVDAATATDILGKMTPKVVIPMHFRNEKCLYPITPVDDFLKGRANVRRVNGSEVEFKKETLPATTETVVLKPVY
ncbi:MAG: MBL fold metallo-hydrolase [Chloroflexi bacterium]|nr:MBL fold metallo-hydrolase [Chloroflexota bacterium]